MKNSANSHQEYTKPPVVQAYQNARTTKARLPRSLTIGLDILEYMAARPDTVTRAAIAKALNVPLSTIYRTLIVLEERDYIARTGPDGALEPTGKLFSLQSTTVAYQRLVTHAEPVMLDLSSDVKQSCNLSIPHAPDMWVVAQQELPEPYGLRIPVGHRYDMPDSAPGLIFAAFTRHSDPNQWSSNVEETKFVSWSDLKAAAFKVKDAGFAQIENPILPDVMDLSCPIFQGGNFVAALTMPYIKTSTAPAMGWCLAALQQAAETLNTSLQGNVLVA